VRGDTGRKKGWARKESSLAGLLRERDIAGESSRTDPGVANAQEKSAAVEIPLTRKFYKEGPPPEKKRKEERLGPV